MGKRQELICKRLIEEGDRLLGLLQSMPPAQRCSPVYIGQADWSFQDILAHQVSAERAYRRLIDDLLAGGEGSPEGFSIDDFNLEQVDRMRSTAWDDLVCEFRDARTETVALAARLTDAQLEQRGRHPFLGAACVEDILQLLYRHNMMHARDIRRAMGVAGK